MLWSDGIGVADVDRPGEPLGPDSRFGIASITKTFTATVVMALRDEGRLSLDDPVDEHISESKHTAVTIRQMLSHTTGMQREPVGDVWDTLVSPDRDELVRGWNEAERVLRPHDRWHYSNLCYAMLGEVISRLDGREWAESVQARILDPLEMRSTTVGLTGPHVQGYYVPPFHDVPVAEPEPDWKAMNPAGGLASTANDLARVGGVPRRPGRRGARRRDCRGDEPAADHGRHPAVVACMGPRARDRPTRGPCLRGS